MKRGWGINERYAQDPIGSDAPRGKDTRRRKHSKDPGWTPTEQRTRERLMKQFCRLEGPSGQSREFRANFDLIDWSR